MTQLGQQLLIDTEKIWKIGLGQTIKAFVTATMLLIDTIRM